MATARPMPLSPPVISATLPASLPLPRYVAVLGLRPAASSPTRCPAAGPAAAAAGAGFPSSPSSSPLRPFGEGDGRAPAVRRRHRAGSSEARSDSCADGRAGLDRVEPEVAGVRRCPLDLGPPPPTSRIDDTRMGFSPGGGFLPSSSARPATNHVIRAAGRSSDGCRTRRAWPSRSAGRRGSHRVPPGRKCSRPGPPPAPCPIGVPVSRSPHQSRILPRRATRHRRRSMVIGGGGRR